MKLIYLANARIPTEKAHGIQIMQMCKTFAMLKIKMTNQNSKISGNLNIELIIPKRFNKIKQNPFEYYGVERIFKIKKLPCLDLIPLRLPRIGFLIQTFSFIIFARIYLLFRKYDILYTREQLAGIFFKKFVLEVHYLPKAINNFHKIIWRRARRIIVINNFIKDKLIEKGVDLEKILVAPDGVDLEKFQISENQEEYRRKLNLPLDKKIILYTGHLYQWKGADILLQTAKQFAKERDFQFLPLRGISRRETISPPTGDLPKGDNFQNFQNVLFVFVGGTEKDIESFKLQVTGYKLNNVLVVGHRPHQEIPYWLKAADVLVLPNSAKEKISQFYTSPLKLFEYMAADRPIVASDLPSIREVLSENNAILVKSDDPTSLSGGIASVLQNSDFSAKIAKQALQDVDAYSWKKRVKNILSFIK